MSLRTQLILRLILASAFLVGITTWLGYKDVTEETQELFDAQLVRSARIILSLIQAQNGISGFTRIQEYFDENGFAVMHLDVEEHDDGDGSDIGHIYETKLAFQIWDNEGNLLVKSYNAPLRPMSSEREGFADTSIDDYRWRTFSLPSKNQQYRCITAERADARNDLIKKISNDLFYMFIILVPVLSLILYLGIDRGLKPLQQLAAQINRRSEKNLDQITTDYRYSEILTIKNELNQLLQRLNDTLAREKRITSDAAHELRTPLAAIRLHAELARSAKNHAQQSESMEQLLVAVDRATHLVEQLLILARLEPELLQQDFVEIDLNALLIDECALLSPLALKKQIQLSFDDSHHATINGNEASLRLLIRNLLTNAITYTPVDGKVAVKLSKDDNNTLLIVEDNGSGIAEEDRERVMERFYRAENHEASGCGIGLSIVSRVIEMHQGSLQLTQADSGQGLKVIVSFRTD